MDVSVVIVNWNVREHLDRALASVLASGSVPSTHLRDIVVVDNASDDGSAEWVRTRFPEVRLIANTSNLGFAAACNQGFAQAEADAALLLNPDAELLPGALDALVAALEADPGAAAAGPKLCGADGQPLSTRRRFPSLATGFLESTIVQDHFPELTHLRRYYCEDLPEQAPHEVDWLVGACLLVRRSALVAVGGLDPRFFMYFEELDWFLRAHAMGWRALYVPAAQVVHRQGASSAQVPQLAHLYFAHSKRVFYAKHFGPLAGWAVHSFLLVSYLLRAVEDAAKLALGHRPRFRRERITLFLSVLQRAARG